MDNFERSLVVEGDILVVTDPSQVLTDIAVDTDLAELDMMADLAVVHNIPVHLEVVDRTAAEADRTVAEDSHTAEHLDHTRAAEAN